MLKIRRSEERGKANHGWLNSYHTFSFGEYYDPNNIGFGPLRVMNEDTVAPGQGFGTHPHNNMEIFSYVISGELAHKDSMGNGRTIKGGELQAMSAGSGVFHSEFNPSKINPVHFLQIWIIPDKKDITPSYAEWNPDAKLDHKPLRLLVSPDSKDGSIKVNQDVSIFIGKLNAGKSLNYEFSQKRKVWLQMISGELNVDNESTSSGDGVAITSQEVIKIKALNESEFLLFDMI